MTRAQEESDMNSQAKRKVNASAASSTTFMPARKAGKNGSTRPGASSWRPYPRPYRLPAAPPRVVVVGENNERAAGRLLWAAIPEAIQARGRAAEVDDDEEKRRERVDPEVRAEPRQTDRQ